MSSPPPFDPYEVLGVSKDAEVEQIKKAHRKLVIKCHPDKVQDESLRARANDEFHKVQRSYEILVDPSERKRYDNQMRLVELKAESFGRGYSSAPSPRTGPSSSAYEFRNGRMYEERVPDNAGSRFFEDDSRYFDEPRGSARKYDGYERRSSESRPTTEKKKSKTVEVKVGGLFSTSKERVQTRDNHSDRKKTRDQERRREASDKYTRSAWVEDEGSDDDVSYFSRREPEPRRRYEETPKKSSKSDPRRKETRRSRDDDFTDEWDYKGVQVAKEYIQRSKVTTPPVEEVRRPTASRSSSARYVEVEPDMARRSSGKRSGTVKEAIRPTSSGKERRPSIEVVEPSRDYEPRKVPSMPTSKSSPANIKIPVSSRPPPPAHRSATAQYAHDNRREAPSIRRSETTPMTTSRHNDNMPSKSSRLRHAETHDSGYSSPGTPEMYQSSSPPKTSTKYLIVEPDEEDYSRGHRTVRIDPEFPHSRRSTRSPSPHSRRPNLSTRGSSRPIPSRSNTSYIVSPESTPRPSMPRHESSRGAHGSPPLSRHGSGRGDKLFGEVDDSYKARYSDDQVRYAKNFGPEDVNYGRYSNERRGSSGQIPRDPYPNRYYGEQRPPTMERSSTFAY